MPKQTKALSIFLLENSGIVVSSPLNPSGASFPFPAGMLANMEIVKNDDFQSFISSICVAQQLTSKDVLIVFGNSLTFQKQIGLLPEEKIAEEVKNFQNLTPFDWVATKVYKNPTGNTLVAINRDFYDVLKQAFERNTVGVIAVVPQFIFTQWLGKQQLNTKTLESLLLKSDAIVQQSLVTNKSAPKTLQEQEEYISKRYSGPLIVGFVLFLLAVFGGTWYILRQQSQNMRKPAAGIVATSSGTLASAAPTIQAEATLAPAIIASPSAVRITISYGASQASVSARLKQALSQKGFTQVSIQSQTSVTVDKPIVIVRPTVSATLKGPILEVMQTVVSDFSSQESSELESDVWITLGN